jgi:hypothetical protein
MNVLVNLLPGADPRLQALQQRVELRVYLAMTAPSIHSLLEPALLPPDLEHDLASAMEMIHVRVASRWGGHRPARSATCTSPRTPSQSTQTQRVIISAARLQELHKDSL